MSEKHKPLEEEIKKAEEMMTEEQKEMSEKRSNYRQYFGREIYDPEPTIKEFKDLDDIELSQLYYDTKKELDFVELELSRSITKEYINEMSHKKDRCVKNIEIINNVLSDRNKTIEDLPIIDGIRLNKEKFDKIKEKLIERMTKEGKVLFIRIGSNIDVGSYYPIEEINEMDARNSKDRIDLEGEAIHEAALLPENDVKMYSNFKCDIIRYTEINDGRFEKYLLEYDDHCHLQALVLGKLRFNGMFMNKFYEPNIIE